MKKKFCIMMAIVLIAAQMFLMVGCESKVHAENLMKNIESKEMVINRELDKENVAATDFAVRLLQRNLKDGENMLISPISVLMALGMTANGAKSETLAQMESAIGLGQKELNSYIYSYRKQLNYGDKYMLRFANSIWFRNEESFKVNEEFLQTCADYYGADIYKAPFDAQTLKDINVWVSEKTDDRIQDIVDSIPEEAVMYLVNALTFEGEWENIYKENQVRKGTFTREDGKTRSVKFMRGEEYKYLSSENMTGFMKDYANGTYSFVALLPNEDISVEEYVASLSGEKLQETLKNVEKTLVYTSMPKFETESSVEMSKVLKNMGIEDAFAVERADFSGLGISEKGNIFISRVLHKTFITVDERGTRAGAASVVEEVNKSEPMIEKEVILDRPFVYAIIDCENNVPLFIGTMMDVAQ